MGRRMEKGAYFFHLDCTLVGFDNECDTNFITCSPETVLLEGVRDKVLERNDHFAALLFRRIAWNGPHI